MTSWQASISKAYMRFDRWRNPPEEELDVAKSRAWFETNVSRMAPRLEFNSQRVAAGGVPAEWIELPESRPDRTLFYLHGGAYCIGSAATHRGMVASIAQAAKARALVVDYRLAPEHPFPAAVEDTQAAYRWLLGEGVPLEQVALVGDSAGAGLLLALLSSQRDAGRQQPAAGVCLSPWVDLSLSGSSWTARAKREPVLSRQTMAQMAQAYLGATDPRTPLASPLYGHLGGLPPLLIQAGSDEVLLSDAEELARKANAAGVHVDLEVWDGMYHVWHISSRMVPEARRAIERIGAWLETRWAGGADQSA